MATKQENDAIEKAAAIIGVFFDNVIILANRYDPTAKKTYYAEGIEGNLYAVKGHAEEWVQEMKEMGLPGTGCGPDCECGADDEEGDEVDSEDDDGNDEKFNR